jgi:hypothetical protein
MGLIFGIVFLSLGLFFINDALSNQYTEGGWVFGLIVILFGFIFGIVIATRKAAYWQIELKDSPGKHPGKWRIVKSKSAEVSDFTRIISEKAAVKLLEE